MSYVGEVRWRFEGAQSDCAPYIHVGRVLVERTRAQYNVGGSVDTATQTKVMADGAVIRATVFQNVPPIITIIPPKSIKKAGENRYNRCFNGLAIKFRDPLEPALPEGEGYLLVGDDATNTMPVDGNGYVDWDAETMPSGNPVRYRPWPMPVDSQMAVQYRPGLPEPHYLSGSGANLCRRSSEWYWTHESVHWRVSARITDPVPVADPEPELTEANTKKMPFDFVASTMPRSINQVSAVPDNDFEWSYDGALTDVGYIQSLATDFVERNHWKVGLLLSESPVSAVGGGALPESRQRTVWIRFESPSRHERYSANGQPGGTAVWGHLRLIDVTAAGAAFTVVGVASGVGESSQSHIVRDAGAIDRGVLRLAPDLTYTISEIPNPLFDTDQDTRCLIPNAGHTVPEISETFSRTTEVLVDDGTNFAAEHTDTYSATVAYTPTEGVFDKIQAAEFVRTNATSGRTWRQIKVPAHSASGSHTLYDETFSWGLMRVTEAWTFDYERTADPLPGGTVGATVVGYSSNFESDEIRSVTIDGQAAMGETTNWQATQDCTATYTVTVGAQVFTIPMTASCLAEDAIDWGWKVDPPPVGTRSSLPSNMAVPKRDADGSLDGPRVQTTTYNIDGNTYSFTYADSFALSFPEKYLDRTREELPYYVLIDSGRTDPRWGDPRYNLPFGFNEHKKDYVGSIGSVYSDRPVPQSVWRAFPIPHVVARPGMLYVKWVVPFFRFNGWVFSVDYIFTTAGHKVMMHPVNEIATSNLQDDAWFPNVTLTAPLDPAVHATIDTLPIDACFNPETNQLYLRYADDPTGCFVQMGDVERTLYKVKPGEEQPDDFIIDKA